MAPKPKTLQDLFRERRMKDMKREHYFHRVKQFWTLVKRLALAGLIGYGVHWSRKNSEKLTSFLKSHTAPVQQVNQDFKEGVSIIKDTLTHKKNDKELQAYHNRRKKTIEEYRRVGIDPVVRYTKQGTKEHREELQFYRKEGVFRQD